MSLKNVVKRRTHKERHQPARRARHGLLEKHKDYVLRAKDYNRKKKQLVELQRKARDRNPDEFAFGMIKSKTINGVHHTPRHVFTNEEVLAMKEVDLPYVLRKLAVEQRKLHSLREELGLFQKTQPSKIHFIDSSDDESGHSETRDEDTTPSQTNSTEDSLDEISVNPIDHKKQELLELEESVRKLKLMARELHLQRELMKNSKAKKKVKGPYDLPVYKWDKERSK
ncbi:hypothetical protein P9112_012679 [Eukaryota sp. TZLM1-RC]